jgi:hypothetical protein
MYKHVGKHKDKKVALLFRQVPGEDHMCLVAYSDLLPRLVHDEVMKVLESPMGQQAENLADALFRHIMADGRNCLEAMHRDNFIKKVPTNQILVTPNTVSSVRLDELNSILNEMSKGEAAIKRLSEIDANKGMVTRKNTPIREVGVPPSSRTTEIEEPSISAVLTDAELAKQRVSQASMMKSNAEQLLMEAQRLLDEAKTLDPNSVTEDDATTKKKTTSKTKKNNYV